MSYPTLWDRAHLSQVFITESRQKARDLFMSIHRPFRRIRVDFCKDLATSSNFIDEVELRSVVESGSLHAHNRLFFIVGEAGSGKSELCQWLEYTSDQSTRLPIHIPRSMTSAAHVAALLRNKLELSGRTSSLQHTPVDAQARYVAASATIRLYEHGNSVLSPIHRWERLLASEAMQYHLVTYLESNPGQPGPSLLSEASLELIAAQAGVDIPEGQLDGAIAELSTILASALDQTVWMGDLRSLLTDLSSQAIDTGRRPLLLLEDVTAFQLLGDLLLDYLIDLTSGHFDAVIGLTTGFERTQLTRASLEGDLTHIHHRLRARFVLTDNSGRAYGLEDDLVNFARAYLKASKREYAAAEASLHPIFGQDLYPFTETALHRAFSHLHEEGNPRQTPRLLLEHVLGAALLSTDIPPLTFDRATYLQRPPTLFRTDEVRDERLISTLRWYGELENSAVTLDPRIPELWGVPVPPDLVSDGKIRVARTYLLPTLGAHDAPHDWHDELRELQHWLDTGDLYPSREVLKRGIEHILLNLGDPRSLANTDCVSSSRSELYYARGEERLPIQLDGNSGDEPGGETSLKLKIERHREDRSILEELAYVGLSGASPSQVCHNLAATLHWTEQRWNEYNSSLHTLLAKKLGGTSANSLILFAWHSLCALVGSTRGYALPTRQLDPIVTYSALSPWSQENHRALFKGGEQLFLHHETVRRLFVGAFTLREGFLDHALYAGVLSTHQPSSIISTLAVLDLAPLRTLPFKVRPGNMSLYELLVPLQRYANALRNFDVHAALVADIAVLRMHKAHLQAQAHLDTELLKTNLTRLRQRCGEVGVIWRDYWDSDLHALATLDNAVATTLDEDNRQVYAVASQILGADSPDIWAYQQFRHSMRPYLAHPYWGAITALEEVATELSAAAQLRYSSGGRLLYGTPGYRAFLRDYTGLKRELQDA